MNSKQKLNQIKLAQWAVRFQEQAASGLTAKAWCDENNITIHTYNYWKHKLKLEYMDSLLPEQHDIVALTPGAFQPSATPQPQLTDTSPLCQLHDSRDSHDFYDAASVCITIGDIRISAGSSVPEETLLQILKAVRHA